MKGDHAIDRAYLRHHIWNWWWLSLVAFAVQGSLLSAQSIEREIVLPLPRGSGFLFSADGQTLITRAYDKGTTNIIGIDISEGGQTLSWEIDASSYAISPSGRWFVTAERDASVSLNSVLHVYSGLGGDLRTSLEIMVGKQRTIFVPPVFSPNDQLVALTGQSGIMGDISPTWISLFDTSTWEESKRLTKNEPASESHGARTALAFSPDSRLIASGSQKGTLDLWSVETGELVWEVPNAHRAQIGHLAYSPDGRYLASGEVMNITADLRRSESRVNLWDASDGTKLRHIRLNQEKYDQIWGLDFSPDGRYLGITQQAKVALLDMSNWTEVWSVEGYDSRRRYFRGMKFSPDGRFAFVSEPDRKGDASKVEVWRVRPEETAVPMPKLTPEFSDEPEDPDTAYLAHCQVGMVDQSPFESLDWSQPEKELHQAMEEIEPLLRGEFLGEFYVPIGEEVGARKAYPIPGTDLIAHADVSFTDESYRVGNRDFSMTLSLGVDSSDLTENIGARWYSRSDHIVAGPFLGTTRVLVRDSSKRLLLSLACSRE